MNGIMSERTKDGFYDMMDAHFCEYTPVDTTEHIGNLEVKIREPNNYVLAKPKYQAMIKQESTSGNTIYKEIECELPYVGKEFLTDKPYKSMELKNFLETQEYDLFEAKYETIHQNKNLGEGVYAVFSGELYKNHPKLDMRGQ